MTTIRKTPGRAAYPRFERPQVDTLITALFSVPAGALPPAEEPVLDDMRRYLIAYYTRRWGLPTIVRDKAGSLGIATG